MLAVSSAPNPSNVVSSVAAVIVSELKVAATFIPVSFVREPIVLAASIDDTILSLKVPAELVILLKVTADTPVSCLISLALFSYSLYDLAIPAIITVGSVIVSTKPLPADLIPAIRTLVLPKFWFNLATSSAAFSISLAT